MADISKLEQQANLLMNCDEEVIKALECCVNDDKGIHGACRSCVLQGKGVDCPIYIRASALDLINRQKAEIDILVRKSEEKQ